MSTWQVWIKVEKDDDARDEEASWWSVGDAKETKDEAVVIAKNVADLISDEQHLGLDVVQLED